MLKVLAELVESETQQTNKQINRDQQTDFEKKKGKTYIPSEITWRE